MNNTVWQEFIGRLYNGFHNTTEVMTLVGYRNAPSNALEDVVEFVEYYTSNDESGVIGNIRSIVKAMAKYSLLRGEDTRFVLVHNHPAGTPDPSDSDKVMADRLLVSSRLMGATSMGSYIFIEGGEIVLVGGKEEEFATQQIRISNQYNPNGSVSMDIMTVRAVFTRIKNIQEGQAIRHHSLTEEVLDVVFNRVDVDPYGLVELDDNNNILAVYELNKLQPNIPNRVGLLELKYSKGMATVFMLDSPRFVVYDKRDDVERDYRGLAEDTKAFIQAMGVSGFPINFYVN